MALERAVLAQDAQQSPQQDTWQKSRVALATPPLTDILLMLLLRRGSQSYDQLRRDLPHVTHAAIRMAVYTLRRSSGVQVEYAAGRYSWIIPPATCPLCGHPVDGGCE